MFNVQILAGAQARCQAGSKSNRLAVLRSNRLAVPRVCCQTARLAFSWTFSVFLWLCRFYVLRTFLCFTFDFVELKVREIRGKTFRFGPREKPLLSYAVS